MASSGIGNGNGNVIKLDRISNLHDSILRHILSFLTTKESVGTSILSTRWQFLWASVPVVDFNEGFIISRGHDLSREEKLELRIIFRDFVNRVLLLSDVSCLEKFHLTLHNSHPGFETWVRTAINRNVVAMSLCLLHDDFLRRLPPILYTSKTLVVLSLGTYILIDPPASVWLPSLKSLGLTHVDFQDDSSFQNLCSGCPVLENLIIVPYTGFNVSVPTLKRLKIEIYVGRDLDISLEQQFNKFIIDGPNLTDLIIIDGKLTGFMLLNLSSLVRANIVVDCTNANPSHLSRYAGRFYQLLNGVANAKHLSLSLKGSKLPGSTMSFITNGRSYVAPTFHRLTNLILDSVGSCGWGMLNLFIECSPKLEVLDINKRCRIVESWSPPPRVPDCLQSCLKNIYIEGFDGEEYDLKAIAYLLKNAKTLKEMTIDCTGLRKEEYNVCEELLQFPKASTHCQLYLLI